MASSTKSPKKDSTCLVVKVLAQSRVEYSTPPGLYYLFIIIIIITEGAAYHEIQQYLKKTAVKEANCRITPYSQTRRTVLFHSVI